jgi:hypothetical protein
MTQVDLAVQRHLLFGWFSLVFMLRSKLYISCCVNSFPYVGYVYGPRLHLFYFRDNVKNCFHLYIRYEEIFFLMKEFMSRNSRFTTVTRNVLV